jgi:cyclophilin family peptidyl-prolyl cis-trans isomerase
MGFVPFGKVVEGMKVVDAIEGMYGEGAPGGNGPRQDRIQTEGNAYLHAQFPKLDYIKSMTLL